MVGLTAVYAICFVAIKAGLTYAPPLAFAGLRLAIAGLALLGLAIVARRPLLPARWEWPWILALALTATAAAYGAMFVSPGRAGAGIAAVLGNLQPLFAVGLAALVLGERMTRADRLALGLGVLGAVVIAAPAWRADSGTDPAGPALALAASLGFAVGSVLIKRMAPRSGLPTITGWQLLVGGVPLLVAALRVERDAGIRWGAEFLALLLFLALPGTALATVVWYRLLQQGDVGRLTMFFFLVPVFGLGIAMVAYNERIGRPEAVGAALLFTGIGLALVQSWRGNNAPRARPNGSPPTRRDTDRSPDLGGGA